jgi:hypothetical protein
MLLLNPEAFGHVFVEEALVRAVGLDPFSVNYKLWDGTLASAPYDLVGGSGRGFDVDLFVGQFVFVEEALGFATVGTPRRGIDGDFHKLRIVGILFQ